jgi:GT2 family glycosyltransferase
MSLVQSSPAHSYSDVVLNKKPKVLISILNWNGGQKTLKCLASIKSENATIPADITTLVIDNGSREEDYSLLETAARSGNFVLKRLPRNLGFTGGHNISIKMAVQEDYDFIWLLNNDATVTPGTLTTLLATMERHENCGAVSPVLRDSEDGTIARCVNTHDWFKRSSTRIKSIEEASRIQDKSPESVWVDGTAILFRVQALNDTGPLDDRLFAYYDDDDIGIRLANKGWFSRCALDATVYHDNRKSVASYPLYLTYLLQRNELLFWYKNTPSAYRRLLWLKVVDRGLFDVSRLYKRVSKAHGDAALLGLRDFIWGRFGAPAYDAKVPLYLRAACKVASFLYDKKL